MENNCYKCSQFEHRDNVPWCKILDCETNGLSPACLEMKAKLEQMKLAVIGSRRSVEQALDTIKRVFKDE